MSKKTNGDEKNKKTPPKAPEPEDDGKATDPSLLQYEKQPFILDKLFRTGSMGRLNAGTPKAEAKGAIGTYEDYHWQLDRMYRKVPETMSLGNIRLKPDSLLYEGEHFILGKMERDVREADGYNPTAGRAESLIDIQEAIKLCKKLPKEPEPCPFPDFTYCGDIQMKSEGCCANITPLPGQVYNFAHPVQLSVDGCGAQPQCGPPDPNQAGCSKGKSCEEKATNFCQTKSPNQCQAARQAMAIYDTITGYDHFPCNVGDRPELQTETTEDGVWSWLYSIIYAIFPVGNDFNCNRGLPAPPPPPCGTPSQTQVQPKKKCCKHRKGPSRAPSTTRTTACGPDPNSFATPCQPTPPPDPSPSKIKRVSSSVQTQDSCGASSSKSNSKSTQN